MTAAVARVRLCKSALVQLALMLLLAFCVYDRCRRGGEQRGHQGERWGAPEQGRRREGVQSFDPQQRTRRRCRQPGTPSEQQLRRQRHLSLLLQGTGRPRRAHCRCLSLRSTRNLPGLVLFSQPLRNCSDSSSLPSRVPMRCKKKEIARSAGKIVSTLPPLSRGPSTHQAPSMKRRADAQGGGGVS